jgi:hypothetical protein
VLQPNADLKIQVYAVWFSMLPTDSPQAFPDAQAVLSDPRVKHYRDSRRAVGARYKNWVPSDVRGPAYFAIQILRPSAFTRPFHSPPSAPPCPLPLALTPFPLPPSPFPLLHVAFARWRSA